MLIILLLTPAVKAEIFAGPEKFSEYIYNNYAEENFKVVYNNFAAELKREMDAADYLKFQKENFAKYNLSYSEIEVFEAEAVNFKEIKNKFSYAIDFGHYYKLKVSYLLEFKHFGSREKRSDKMVYIRKIKDDFQIFWDYETALKNDESAASEVGDDQSE